MTDVEEPFDPPDTEELLLRARDQLETARSVPMSASVMVNRDDLLVLVDDAIAGLPEELRQARWLLKEREEFLAKARREAEDIIDAGRAQARKIGLPGGGVPEKLRSVWKFRVFGAHHAQVVVGTAEDLSDK